MAGYTHTIIILSTVWVNHLEELCDLNKEKYIKHKIRYRLSVTYLQKIFS